MARKTGPSFVLTRRLITTESDAAYIDKKMRIVERLYNTGVKHCLALLEKVKADYWYQYSLKMYKAAKDTDEQKAWADEIFLVAASYGLTEYDIHAYLGKGKANAYGSGIGINIVQKAGTALYGGVKKALFGKKLHFRKYGSTESFEDKKANSGIIYHPKKGAVSVMDVKSALSSAENPTITCRKQCFIRLSIAGSFADHSVKLIDTSYSL